MQKKCLKSQKSFYHFLFDISVTNCYKLSIKSVLGYWLKCSAYKAFREELVEALFDCGECLTKPPGRVAIIEEKDIHKAPAEEYGQGPI